VRHGAFAGEQATKVHHGTNEIFGKKFQLGDVVGVMLDLHDNNISK
jgi:hypothetical protein